MSGPTCAVCDCNLTLSLDWELGELVDCDECGSLLEVTGLHPIILAEAPEEDEDWGE